MLGATLALASALLFGLNNATVRRGVINATVLQGMAVTVPLGIPIFIVFAVLMGGFTAMEQWPLSSYLWMALAGVVHFVVGRYGNYRAVQAMGATLSTPIQQLSILVSLLVAVVFLQERINGMNALGILLILFGPVVVMRRSKKPTKESNTKAFKPRYGLGIFWGFVCALGYGFSPLFIVYGMGHNGTMADSVGGVLVSYLAATLVVLVMVIASGGRTYLTGYDRASFYWFAVSAVLVAFSQLFRYLALAVAPVSVVVPIQRLSVVFRILFNAIFNRQYEVLDLPVIVVVFLSILGAVALAIDTRLVVTFIPLPLWLESLLVQDITSIFNETLSN